MTEAKVIEDSISLEGKRITTLQVKFHRFILPEFNTHRVFSRNFSSSRAIPTTKLIEQVSTDPAMPVYWGKNQAGMQAKEELIGEDYDNARDNWLLSAKLAARMATNLLESKAHKQITNRVLEPYMRVTGIVTSTEWDNFFSLREHPDAQPEIHLLAVVMKQALESSTPTELKNDEWHLPYVSKNERRDSFFKPHDMLKKLSVARCCRVSYLKHDGDYPSIDEDLALFTRLVKSVPIHASPLEHQACPGSIKHKELWGNFNGWIQYRKLWEHRNNASAQPRKILSLKDLMCGAAKRYE